jgi:hypothetical protein
MPEIDFTINRETGEMEMKVEGVKGPACADIASIATELLGAPTREENTSEFYARAQTAPQVLNQKS